MKLPLDEQYRPRTFPDVAGLPEAKRTLSRLAQLGIRRNLLLWGPSGSGKTSLVRIYAAALHCSARLADGSPCGSCASCSSEDYLFEYDTPKKGGDVKRIAAFLDWADLVAERQSVFLFFDEAQALTPQATELFLKRLERHDQNVLHAFATTATPEKFREQFRSRLTKIEVGALSQAAAISFLRDIAIREQISFTSEGLSLLAAIERGSPRAMLQRLGTLALTGRVVDLEAIKEHFGRENFEALFSYMCALADGDAAKQISTMESWPGPLNHKIEAVIRFLVTIYHNNIRGFDVDACPLSYAMKPQREEIARRFCHRWGFEKLTGLTQNWFEMLNFWVQHTACSPKLSIFLFQDLVNRGLSQRSSIVAELPTNYLPDAPAIREIGDDTGDRFFDYTDAREIINRSSWFLQETGLCLNAAFVISPLHVATEEEARGAVRAFLNELGISFRGLPLDMIVLHERDATPLARILARIPGFELQKASIDSLCDKVEDKLGWMVKTSYLPGGLSPKAMLKFHWQETLRLCETMPEPGTTDEAQVSGLRRLVRRRRLTGAVVEPMLEYHGRFAGLAPEEHHGLEFLSALDAGAFNALRSGWELEEHRYRSGQLAVRKEQLKVLDALSLDASGQVQKLNELQRDWRHEADSHRARWIRRWTGALGDV